jgi:hypothetical protein
MKDVKINGYRLRFDWGTMEHIGFATGLDPANPLEGVSVYGQAAAILYGALARVDEIEEKPIACSVEKSKQLIKEFSGAQVKKLIDAYNIEMIIDVDDIEEPTSDEPKKERIKK